MKGIESFRFCYIDDIIIFSQDEYQHKKHLHDVANRLAAYSLKLNFNKCLLGASQLTALGYMLSAEGLAASDDKIKAIQQLPEPKTVKDLRQALGLINYQRKFIPNAARILAPLNVLFKGEVTNAKPISFTSEAKSAFCDIKQTLADTTYLAHPCVDADLSLHTDASNVALGAILEQPVAGKTEVLGYFSKTLNDTQRRYFTYDLELLAMHSAVKYFEYMLMDKSFTIFTDNKSLVNTFLKPSANHTSKQVRQLSYVSQFDCQVLHKPGIDNNAADCLSRLAVHHIFEKDDIPVTISEIVAAQQLHVSSDAFSLPCNSSIQIEQMIAPNCNLPV